MGIGYRIKEARERLGLTQTELGKLVGVTGSAITNYEKETSHPKEQVIYSLMEKLEVDANYLFQDCVNVPKKKNDVTLYEFDMIKKYRIISNYSQKGKEAVDYILNREYELATITNSIVDTNRQFTQCELNAAHLRTDIEIPEGVDTSEDDIMDNENF